jgi:hypothetical protein
MEPFMELSRRWGAATASRRGLFTDNVVFEETRMSHAEFEHLPRLV